MPQEQPPPLPAAGRAAPPAAPPPSARVPEGKPGGGGAGASATDPAPMAGDAALVHAFLRWIELGTALIPLRGRPDDDPEWQEATSAWSASGHEVARVAAVGPIGLALKAYVFANARFGSPWGAHPCALHLRERDEHVYEDDHLENRLARDALGVVRALGLIPPEWLADASAADGREPPAAGPSP